MLLIPPYILYLCWNELFKLFDYLTSWEQIVVFSDEDEDIELQ